MKKIKLVVKPMYTGRTEEKSVSECLADYMNYNTSDGGAIETAQEELEVLATVVSNLVERLTADGKLGLADLEEILHVDIQEIHAADE